MVRVIKIRRAPESYFSVAPSRFMGRRLIMADPNLRPYLSLEEGGYFINVTQFTVVVVSPESQIQPALPLPRRTQRRSLSAKIAQPA